MITLPLIAAAVTQIAISGATQPVGTDADDPAIWVNHANPQMSRIYGTDKTKAPAGAIYAFDLNGRTLQRIGNVDRPNNIDVEYGLRTPFQPWDIAVATERRKGRLRIFRINPATGLLIDVSGQTDVAMRGIEDFGEPMGISLYKSSDRRIYAVVSPKTGLADGYLEQYELTFNPTTQRVDSQLVRRFGQFSGQGEIEAVAVDDELGYVYYSDEGYGIRKYRVDPRVPRANDEVSAFARSGVKGDREGIGIYRYPMGSGYIVLSDQRPGNSVYHVFRREGDNERVGEFAVGADSTDGLDIASHGFTERYFCGLFVAMDSQRKRFVIVNWHDIETPLHLGPKF